MSFKILIHDDVSMDCLIKWYADGRVILKTPHVGNIYPNNLAIASLGIPMLFYDRTLGTKDLNFHPNKIIVGGESEEIAERDILTTHAIINRLPLSWTQKFVGSKLVNFHMSAVKLALPTAHCFTYTDYIQGNKDKILQLLERVTESRPHLWSRIVNEKGEVSRYYARDWNDITKLGVFGLTNMDSGWLIPNPVSILFHGTIDIAKAQAEDVYLLSGPDMYKYINSYQNDLDYLYDHLRKTLEWNIPRVVQCHIIPVVHFRFIIEFKYKTIMDSLVDLYLKYKEIDDMIKIKSYQNLNTQTLIYSRDLVKDEILSCIKVGIKPLGSTMFYKIEDAKCFTQYDLLDGHKIYIHPWSIRSKISEVSTAYNFLFECYSYVRLSLRDDL